MESRLDELKKLVNIPYGRWRDDMFLEAVSHEVDAEIGSRFQGHGITKGTFSMQAEQLDYLLTNGISADKNFYSAPYSVKDAERAAGAALGTSGGTCYKDGLFTVLSDVDETDFKKGIKCVIVNVPLYDKIDKLSEYYPQMRFVKMCDVGEYMKQECEKKDLQNSNNPDLILDDVISTNDIYQNPKTGLVGFIPKKGVSQMQAYETLSKLKEQGLLLTLSAAQKDGSRFFVANPNEVSSNNSQIIDALRKCLAQKMK